MKKYFNKIHYSKKGKKSIFAGILGLLSIGYYFCTVVRHHLYRLKFIRKTRLSAYVISIGNLTTGGTGKTPITLEVASYIKDKYNKKVAVLSRGYGGKNQNNQVNVISDGEKIYFDAYHAGDEPYWLATNSEGLIVLTGKNRISLGKYAIENFGAEVLILDDGFQHIKLERDLNLLVIDGCKRFGNNKLLPAGPLREHISQIKRSDKIIIVNKNPLDICQGISCLEFMDLIKKKYKIPVFLCKFNHSKIYNIVTQELIGDEIKKVFAFSGIAQPGLFFNNLKDQNYTIVRTKEFKDHHLYTEDDIKTLIEQAEHFGAEAIITTEKDSVKIQKILDKIKIKIPVYAVKLEIETDIEGLINLKPVQQLPTS